MPHASPISRAMSLTSDSGLREVIVSKCRETVHPTGPFPGWGDTYEVPELMPMLSTNTLSLKKHIKLGELSSTAICGNDITSSCFYTTGALVAAAGIYAPLAAVIASGTLWLFRWVYTEAVTALPFNGGIYNILLNTMHSKKAAGLVATLTMLSYVATCVVSALTAGRYLQVLIDPTKVEPWDTGCFILPTAIGLIIFFACLKLIGISESAMVAAVLFVTHMTVMIVLIFSSVVSVALPNAGVPYDVIASNLRKNWAFTGRGDTIWKITMGFSNSMLGVSGFESSANFVEEQADGVFPKTLRNMWCCASFLNIALSFVCVFATDLEMMVREKDNSLAYLGKQAWGRPLEIAVSVDAFMVLAAAVLTAFVGIGGLCSRMAADRCLPSIFATGDRITTILFMFFCISLVLILKGNSTDLSSCYSFAFLTVMALFAGSLFVLQCQRPKLPRAMKNNLFIPFIAGSLVIVALVAAMILNYTTLGVFAVYVAFLISAVGGFLFRLQLLKALEKLLDNSACSKSLAAYPAREIARVRAQSSVVYFAKTSSVERLNSAIQYIIRNEDTNYVRVVHVSDDQHQAHRQNLELFGGLLDAFYPSIKVDIVFVRGTFGAGVIEHLSGMWGVSPNLMFINCPRSELPGQRLSDLRGVRVIMGYEEEDEKVDSHTSDESDDSSEESNGVA